MRSSSKNDSSSQNVKSGFTGGQLPSDELLDNYQQDKDLTSMLQGPGRESRKNNYLRQSHSSNPISNGIPIEETLEEALIDLYLSVKVRSNDEIDKYSESMLKQERDRLRETDAFTILEYVKSSIEILMHLKESDEDHESHPIKKSKPRFDQRSLDIDDNETPRQMSNQSSPSQKQLRIRGESSQALNDTRSRLADAEELSAQFEKQLQKYEAEVRNHIKIEQQLKLHIECTQEKLDETEKINLKLQSQQDEVNKLETKFKDFQNQIEERDQEIERLKKANFKARKAEATLQKRIEELLLEQTQNQTVDAKLKESIEARQINAHGQTSIVPHQLNNSQFHNNNLQKSGGSSFKQSKTPNPSSLNTMLPTDKAEELRRKYNSFMEGGALNSVTHQSTDGNQQRVVGQQQPPPPVTSTSLTHKTLNMLQGGNANTSTPIQPPIQVPNRGSQSVMIGGSNNEHPKIKGLSHQLGQNLNQQPQQVPTGQTIQMKGDLKSSTLKKDIKKMQSQTGREVHNHTVLGTTGGGAQPQFSHHHQMGSIGGGASIVSASVAGGTSTLIAVGGKNTTDKDNRLHHVGRTPDRNKNQTNLSVYSAERHSQGPTGDSLSVGRGLKAQTKYPNPKAPASQFTQQTNGSSQLNSVQNSHPLYHPQTQVKAGNNNLSANNSQNNSMVHPYHQHHQHQKSQAPPVTNIQGALPQTSQQQQPAQLQQQQMSSSSGKGKSGLNKKSVQNNQKFHLVNEQHQMQQARASSLAESDRLQQLNQQQQQLGLLNQLGQSSSSRIAHAANSDRGSSLGVSKTAVTDFQKRLQQSDQPRSKMGPSQKQTFKKQPTNPVPQSQRVSSTNCVGPYPNQQQSNIHEHQQHMYASDLSNQQQQALTLAQHTSIDQLAAAVANTQNPQQIVQYDNSFMPAAGNIISGTYINSNIIVHNNPPAQTSQPQNNANILPQNMMATQMQMSGLLNAMQGSNEKQQAQQMQQKPTKMSSNSNANKKSNSKIKLSQTSVQQQIEGYIRVPVGQLDKFDKASTMANPSSAYFQHNYNPQSAKSKKQQLQQYQQHMQQQQYNQAVGVGSSIQQQIKQVNAKQPKNSLQNSNASSLQQQQMQQMSGQDQLPHSRMQTADINSQVHEMFIKRRTSNTVIANPTPPSHMPQPSLKVIQSQQSQQQQQNQLLHQHQILMQQQPIVLTKKQQQQKMGLPARSSSVMQEHQTHQMAMATQNQTQVIRQNPPNRVNIQTTSNKN